MNFFGVLVALCLTRSTKAVREGQCVHLLKACVVQSFIDDGNNDSYQVVTRTISVEGSSGIIDPRCSWNKSKSLWNVCYSQDDKVDVICSPVKLIRFISGPLVIYCNY